MWQCWINAIIGVWMIVAAFVITTIGGGNFWNDLLVGIVVAVLGFWAAAKRPGGQV